MSILSSSEVDPIAVAFLNGRSKSFGVTENHVLPLKKDVLREKSAEKEIEIQPEKQANSKVSKCNQDQIEMLDNYELNPVVVDFLNDRPKPFGLAKNHVWSLKKDVLQEKNTLKKKLKPNLKNEVIRK